MIVTGTLIFYLGKQIWRLGLGYTSHESDPLFNRKIRIAVDEESCKDLASQLLRNCKDTRILGFDCEWTSTKDGTRKPVALLQFSSHDGLCALFRLNKLKGMCMPLELKALLEDPSVLKVGVSPLVDAAYLLKDQGVVVRGCIDLRHLSGNEAGLAALAKSHLGVVLSKDLSVRCSNWEADVLDAKQVDYAALDALASLRIFWALVGDKTPKMCEQWIDIPYNAKPICGKQTKNNPSSDKRVCPPSSLKTLKKPLYEGVFMQKPDGSTLVTCKAQKANWYLKKGLAVKVADDPLTIRLKFEPDMPSVEESNDKEYYCQLKDNCCVVCGSTTSHLRKNVVPVEYRKHFPVELKSHLSHDVLLMCTTCHAESIEHDLKLRQHLAQKCRAPFTENQLVLAPELVTLKTAAKTMLAQSGVPQGKIRECHSVIVNYLERLDYDNGTLADIARINPRIKDDSCKPHNEKVVAYYQMGGGGIFRLQTIWRQHFLDTMDPRFLPKYWSVNHGQTLPRTN